MLARGLLQAIRSALRVVWLFVFPAGVFASAVSGTFGVRITLSAPSSLCTNTVLSKQTNATVRVTCNTEVFVSIEPAAGAVGYVAGVHGGAYSYVTRSNRGANAFLGSGNASLGAGGVGTVTALRTLDLTADRDRVEMLVTF